MKNKKNFLAVLLSAVLILCIAIPVFANTDISAPYQDTAKYLLEAVADPNVGSVGGEWTIIGLARSSYTPPDTYYEKYYENLVRYMQDHDGVLHDKKYTEYSRVILALTAMGKDPSDIGGYNLLEKLADYEKAIWQGINGSVFALIALDSADYEIPVSPEAKTQATRELYIENILRQQLEDGGFALSGDIGDPDITAMVLQALARYQNMEKVKAASDQALQFLSEAQNDLGGFASWGATNSESTVQVLIALCELGIDIEDERFVKNGNTLLDNLMLYYKQGHGFAHTPDKDTDSLMATEQVFCALVAYERVKNGKPALYQMQDVLRQETGSSPEDDEQKPNVEDMPAGFVNVTYKDVLDTEENKAVYALAARGIIDGQEDFFMPEEAVSRAEFAAMMVKGLGLPLTEKSLFTDVQETEAYAAYVNTACTSGLMNGITEAEFAPDAPITKEQAAIVIANAAELRGIDQHRQEIEIRDMLAQFTDYMTVSNWAKESLAFCYDTGIFSQDDLEISPTQAVTREEAADMLYNMLTWLDLL